MAASAAATVQNSSLMFDHRMLEDIGLTRAEAESLS
jgi:hypothetical protein